MKSRDMWISARQVNFKDRLPNGQGYDNSSSNKIINLTNKKWPGGTSKIKNCLHNRQAGVQVVLALQIDENIIWFWQVLEKEDY